MQKSRHDLTHLLTKQRYVHAGLPEFCAASRVLGLNVWYRVCGKIWMAGCSRRSVLGRNAKGVNEKNEDIRDHDCGAGTAGGCAAVWPGGVARAEADFVPYKIGTDSEGRTLPCPS